VIAGNKRDPVMKTMKARLLVVILARLGFSNASTAFVDISPMVVIPGTNTAVGVATNYFDMAGATNRPTRYYRVRYGS
jgi:hypothetical protein